MPRAKERTMYLTCGACGSETAASNELSVNKYINQVETVLKDLILAYMVPDDMPNKEKMVEEIFNRKLGEIQRHTINCAGPRG